MYKFLLISLLFFIVLTVPPLGKGKPQPVGYQNLKKKDYRTQEYINAQLAGRQYLATQLIQAGAVKSAQKEILSGQINYAINYYDIATNFCWYQVIVVCNLSAECIGDSYVYFCA